MWGFRICMRRRQRRRCRIHPTLGRTAITGHRWSRGWTVAKDRDLGAHKSRGSALIRRAASGRLVVVEKSAPPYVCSLPARPASSAMPSSGNCPTRGRFSAWLARTRPRRRLRLPWSRRPRGIGWHRVRSLSGSPVPSRNRGADCHRSGTPQYSFGWRLVIASRREVVGPMNVHSQASNQFEWQSCARLGFSHRRSGARLLDGVADPGEFFGYRPEPALGRRVV